MSYFIPSHWTVPIIAHCLECTEAEAQELIDNGTIDPNDYHTLEREMNKRDSEQYARLDSCKEWPSKEA